jgi:hypothetical protein
MLRQYDTGRDGNKTVTFLKADTVDTGSMERYSYDSYDSEMLVQVNSS